MKKITLHEGKFRRMVLQEGWEFLERVDCGGVVVILAVTEDHEIVLVEQKRVPVGRNVVELPAGLANDLNEYKNETLAEAAKRELLEETGYLAGEMKPIFVGPASAASSGDVITLYRASRLKKISKGGGDHTERITVHTVLLKNVDRWLKRKERAGCLVDPKIYTGLYFLKNENLNGARKSVKRKKG